MASLGSQVSELDGIQKSKESLDSWTQRQENSVAEMLTRPAKLRPDAAQLEINLVTDMRQTVIEKQAVLDDIEMRLQSIGTAPDHNSKIALDTLDEHVSKAINVVGSGK
jgi:hypothetical protein